MRRRLFLFLIILVLLINSIGCSSQQTTIDVSGKGTYPLSQVQEDFKQFEDLIKTYNPIKYGDKDEVYKAFETQYKLLKDNMTEQEFLRIMSPVISKISCGHTYIDFSSICLEQMKDKALYLPLLIKVVDDGLFLYYDGSDSSIPAGAMISTINGRDSKDIINIIKNSISSDGSNTSLKYFQMNNNFSELYFKYVDASDQFNIGYLNVNSNKAWPEHANVKAVNKAQLNAIKNSAGPSKDSGTVSKLVPGKDYAVLTVSSFNYYDPSIRSKFEGDIDNFFNALKESNIGNLILDLRGNLGGDPYCSSYIFTHLIDKSLPYFCKDTFGYYELRMPLSPASNCFNGKLYILIDGGCFSSTGHLCSLLKYYNRGVFIGDETGGSFTCTDGSRSVSLKNTGINIHCSTDEYTTAVSGMTPGRGIMPDYPIKYKMKDYLARKDLEMELAVEMIKKSAPLP